MPARHSHVLIFANGDLSDGPMVRRALTASSEPFVIAADGGARLAKHLDLHVDLIIGDMDSLDDEDLTAFAAQNIEIQRHPPEKDATDLELALKKTVDYDPEWVRIIGGLGNRFDQTLANVYLLALPQLNNSDVALVAGQQEIRLLHPGRHRFTGQPGDTVSLIPIGGDVHGITTEHLYYPLNDETLYFGPARGVSNVMRGEWAQVTHKTGMLLLIHAAGQV